MAYFYATCTVGVTIYSTGGEIPPSFEFYIVTHSYSSRPFLSALALPNTFDDYSQPPLILFSPTSFEIQSHTPTKGGHSHRICMYVWTKFFSMGKNCGYKLRLVPTQLISSLIPRLPPTLAGRAWYKLSKLIIQFMRVEQWLPSVCVFCIHFPPSSQICCFLVEVLTYICLIPRLLVEVWEWG